GLQNFADSPKHNLAERLTIAKVSTTLRRVADDLERSPLDSAQMENIEQVLQGADTGFRSSHDIAVATRITNTLIDELGERRARDALREFRDRPGPLANACRKAAESLRSHKGRSGS